MKTIYGITRWQEDFPLPVVAIGVFDGLHHGHRLLIRKTVERARAIGGTAVVMTFDPHPLQILHPEKDLSLIVSLPYRLKLMEEQGVEVCLVIRFTRRFADMDYQRFIDHYLRRRLHAAEVVVGEDFYFGRGRQGSAKVLADAGRQFGFRVHEIPVTKVRGHKEVSSSRVRECLARGDICGAQRLLDRPVAIMGKVVKGDRRGRTLGYPTANLDAAVTGFAPLGVYCVNVHIGKRMFAGMANIGYRPSFKKRALPNIEVHIFDFSKNLYGRVIFVEFLKKIRDEQTFSSVEALVQQLRADERQARQWFSVAPLL